MNSRRPILGRLKVGSGEPLGRALAAFTPLKARRAVGAAPAWRPPYLHDGRAATLEDAVAQHTTAELSTGERAHLLAYLGTL